jgi:multicomponent Na+:H+ antiporter subunit C
MIASATLYALAGAALFAIGIHALIVRAHLLRKIIALNITGSGVFLFLVAIAARTPEQTPDPIPHAMVLTGIVVSVCATALALALARRVQETTGRMELPEKEDA